MKLVKEHIILEKFEEDGDPVIDLGIGAKKFINSLPELFLEADNDNLYYWTIKLHPNKIVVAHNVSKINNSKLLQLKPMLEYNKKIIKKIGAENVLGDPYPAENITPLQLADPDQFPYIYIPINPRYTNWVTDTKAAGRSYTDPKKIQTFIGINIRESLNEKFTKESDPIKDMGIGFNAIKNLFWEEIEKEFPLLKPPKSYEMSLVTFYPKVRKIRIDSKYFSDVGIISLSKALRKIESRHANLFKVTQWPEYKGVYFQNRRNKAAIIKIL
jgi:hypothetical protein